MYKPSTRQPEFDKQHALELPGRYALSLIDPSLTNGLMSYANAAQTTPTTQGGATSSPLFTNGLSAVGSAAQGAQSTPSGSTVQNLNSVNSSGIATTNPG
jgi:hypothetical protein